MATATSFTTVDLFCKTSPFLEASRASSFVALSEYWILIFSLILSISVGVKLLISATATLFFSATGWISYLYVWDLTTKLK